MTNEAKGEKNAPNFLNWYVEVDFFLNRSDIKIY